MRKGNWLPALVLGVCLLGLWWAATYFAWVNPAFLPSPGAVLQRTVRGLVENDPTGAGAGIRPGYLATALGQTLAEALAGCFFGALIGIPVGVIIAKTKVISAAIQPYLAASQAIPAVAIAPMLVVWIGYGFTSVVVLCVIMVVFPIIISTSVGMAGIDSDVVGAARLDGAHGLTLLWHIELPLAFPSIVGGLKTGFTLSITGAVVGEMIIGGNGLGTELTRAQGAADIRGMFAVVLVMAVAAMAIYGSLYVLERRAALATGISEPRARKGHRKGR
ncbi:NitT/TauT family transport system permease protein [Actinobaculum suis]|uniref:NitT/TauT family transport system permease protein n=1 Tax=Actinobaculum suis TaxID=1657 RepID=A0A1G7C1H7_9ACTO|nr:ABC transporter permease [Actinobaculum suis]SDE33214.1 NitT/TauT family transport system permease protein [Actinobaculum suis]